MTKMTTVSLDTIICNTIINLLSDIETGSLQLNAIKMLNKAYDQHIQDTNYDASQHKGVFLLIYSVGASTCMKNGKLTALVNQYSDGKVKYYCSVSS